MCSCSFRSFKRYNVIVQFRWTINSLIPTNEIPNAISFAAIFMEKAKKKKQNADHSFVSMNQVNRFRWNSKLYNFFMIISFWYMPQKNNNETKLERERERKKNTKNFKRSNDTNAYSIDSEYFQNLNKSLSTNNKMKQKKIE